MFKAAARCPALQAGAAALAVHRLLSACAAHPLNKPWAALMPPFSGHPHSRTLPDKQRMHCEIPIVAFILRLSTDFQR